MNLKYPIPTNEEGRLWALSEFDIDYTEMSEVFKDLVHLAAKITKSEVSLVNLIDSYTQWSVSSYGIEIEQMERTESVCQYTVSTNNEYFEVKALSKDERFKDKFYVVGDPMLDYYFGVPLVAEGGYSIGALCVMDKNTKQLSPENIELLKIIGKEVVNRLVTLKTIQELKSQAKVTEELRKKVAHDIRGPLGGIISLTKIISMQGENNKLSDVLEFIAMIQKAGTSLLDLATEILNSEDKQAVKSNDSVSDGFSLEAFKQKLERLYLPQAKNKDINYSVTLMPDYIDKPFPKNKLLQITGNLITNAIKFTPVKGKVDVGLGLNFRDNKQELVIKVADNGIGINNEAIEHILAGRKDTSDGTDGEVGFGFGLALVKRLVDDLKGIMTIQSVPNEGTTFTITLKWAH